MEITSIISLVGFFVGLIVLMILVYRGHSIIWVAPVCAFIVALLGGLRLLDSYLGNYMQSATEYILTWFPTFLCGAIYGKIMEDTGSARSFANKLVALIKPRFSVLAIVLLCLLMTLGKLPFFAIVFAICPIGYAIFHEANLPHALLPGTIALGTMGVLITDASLQGLLTTILIVGFGYLYLELRMHYAKKKEFSTETEELCYEQSKWHWICGVVPIIVVVLMLTVLPHYVTLTPNKSIVLALFAGILVTCIMNVKQFKTLLPVINKGANQSASIAIANASAIGFGSIIVLVSGFVLFKDLLLYIPVALPTSVVDALPYSASVLTLLVATKCKHKESYWDISVIAFALPIVITLLIGLIWKFVI